jgi:ADP-ribose pyrophosphatase YjhB (NUDIX family)
MLKSIMKQATLLFLINDNQILLAMKKRGFGVGRWNGVGGKPEENENIIDTAIRETQEEINVTPKNISQVASLDFYFQNKPEWNQQVLVYITKDWEGEPIETEEMKPQWFNKSNLPFESMWPDDPFWLPLVLSDKKIKAEFTFGDNDIVLNKKINEIQSF